MENKFIFPTKIVYLLCLMLLMLYLSSSQTPIGVNCTYKQGSQMNCRDYCSTYFQSQPQLGWYNITSQQCQPLLICSWPLHYYNYPNNNCYTDATMKQVAPSQYPPSLIHQGLASFYLDNICVNGQPQSGIFQDAKCYCFQLWKDSGNVDMYGYPYKCDEVVGPGEWKGYYIDNLVMGEKSTVIMYGRYTPQQLQVVYEQLLSQQHTQTYNFITKYERPLLAMIYKQLPQQSLIRQHEKFWFITALGIIYMVFAFSYLTEQTQIIKVSRKQLAERIRAIINDRSAIQGVV